MHKRWPSSRRRKFKPISKVSASLWKVKPHSPFLQRDNKKSHSLHIDYFIYPKIIIVPQLGTHFFPYLMWLAAVPPSDLSSRATCSGKPCLNAWLSSLLHERWTLSFRALLCVGPYWLRWIDQCLGLPLDSCLCSWHSALGLTQVSLSKPICGRTGTVTC